MFNIIYSKFADEFIAYSLVSHDGFDDLISNLSMCNKKNLEALHSRKKTKPQLLFQIMNNKMNSLRYATCFDGLDGLVLLP